MRIWKCGIIAVSHGTVLGPMVHRSHALVWMDEGTCDVKVGSEWVTASRHDIVLVPPGVAAMYQWTPSSVRMGYLYFRPDADPGWRTYYRLAADDIIPPLLRHALWLTLNRPEGWEDALQSATGCVLGALTSGNSRTDLEERPVLPETMERVFVHLGAIWADGPMRSPSLAELARAANCAPEYLSRIFTRTLGLPPLLTLRLLRLQRAAALLKRTDLAVHSVAHECGYANEYHFSSAFKTWSGMSPSAFRTSDTSTPDLPGELAKIARYLQIARYIDGWYISERVLNPELEPERPYG